MVDTWQPLVDDDDDPHEARYAGDPADIIDALADLLERRPAWHAEAACRGRGAAEFYPERGETTAAAKAVCAGCSVRDECLGAALPLVAWADHGVWGGTSADERKRLRSRQANAA